MNPTDQLARDLDAFRTREKRAKDPKAKEYSRSQSQRDRLEREYREGYAAYLVGQFAAQEIAGAAPVMGEHFTTIEAARSLGISRYRIWQLVKSGELTAVKVGRDWLISAATLANFTRKPKGRPKKVSTEVQGG